MFTLSINCWQCGSCRRCGKPIWVYNHFEVRILIALLYRVYLFSLDFSFKTCRSSKISAYVLNTFIGQLFSPASNGFSAFDPFKDNENFCDLTTFWSFGMHLFYLVSSLHTKMNFYACIRPSFGKLFLKIPWIFFYNKWRKRQFSLFNA